MITMKMKLMMMMMREREREREGTGFPRSRMPCLNSRFVFSPPPRIDTAKGSFYANPQIDIKTNDPELLKRHGEYLGPNIWPKDLPELEVSFKALGCLIVEVGKLVGKACDKFGPFLLPPSFLMACGY